MTLPVWNGTAADESSGNLNVLVSPTVTVTDKATGAKPSLFSDRAGSVGIGNPFTANADGSIEFYVAPGRYKIEADDGSGNTATWDNQIIGTLHGIDQPAAGEFPEYDAGNDRWVARQAGYLDPEHATDSGTDTFVSATNTTVPGDGVKITRDFRSANSTPTPTLDGKTITDRDGNALWASAISGPHTLQRDQTADTYLLLDPNATTNSTDPPNSIVKRDSVGHVNGADPATDENLSTKKYVDDQDESFEQQRAQAWVNFDGTGTVAIRDHYNVSSITDDGTGDYTVNLTNGLADTNYAILLTAATPASRLRADPVQDSNVSTGSFRFFASDDAGTATDAEIASAAIFGGN